MIEQLHSEIDRIEDLLEETLVRVREEAISRLRRLREEHADPLAAMGIMVKELIGTDEDDGDEDREPAIMEELSTTGFDLGVSFARERTKDAG